MGPSGPYSGALTRYMIVTIRLPPTDLECLAPTCTPSTHQHAPSLDAFPPSPPSMCSFSTCSLPTRFCLSMLPSCQCAPSQHVPTSMHSLLALFLNAFPPSPPQHTPLLEMLSRLDVQPRHMQALSTRMWDASHSRTTCTPLMRMQDVSTFSSMLLCHMCSLDTCGHAGCPR
jgi:hypothetical protein